MDKKFIILLCLVTVSVFISASFASGNVLSNVDDGSMQTYDGPKDISSPNMDYKHPGELIYGGCGGNQSIQTDGHNCEK